ncbi:MAG: O-antigen ligase family protein [Planctomycetota bacterium]
MVTAWPSWGGWGWAIAGLVVAGLAVGPAVVPSTPVMFWDDDPRAPASLGAQAVELGPTGMAVWQLVVVLVSAAVVGLGGGRRRLGGWAWAEAGAVALGSVVLGWHMFGPGARWEDWTSGGAWLTAVALALAGRTLGGSGVGRRWAWAVLVGASVPIFAESAWYVFVEHPASVAHFEENREAVLAGRGLEPGSQGAVLFERRLRFDDATGTFGLANVLASVAGALGAAGLGLVVGGVAGRGGRRAASVAGVMGLGTLALTGSKGAAVAVGLAGVMLGVWWVVRGWAGWRGVLPVLGVGLVGTALGAVFVRGWMGPPEAEGAFVAGRLVEGERSLLFRYQYFRAAFRMVGESPGLGVGPGGFAEAYPRLKEPLNPESVTSSHSVFVDYVAMLGVGGWAWSAVLVGWLWRAGRRAAAADVENGGDEPAIGTRGRVWLGVAAAFGVVGVSLVVRRGGLLPEAALLWLVAAGAWAAVVAVLGGAVKGGRGFMVAGWVAAGVVLVHNQVEMGFFQPGSAGLLWFVVGLAAGPGEVDEDRRETRRSFVAAGFRGVFWAGLLGVMVVYAAGVVRHEAAAGGAERALRRGDVGSALTGLEAMQDAAGLDVTALRWRVRLGAVEPMVVAARRDRADMARRFAERGLGWIAEAGGGDPATQPRTALRLEAQVRGQLARITGEPADRAAAESAYRRLRDRSPYNVLDALAYADLAAEAGRTDEAVERYGRVLELRELGYLDPADPLSEEQLERVKRYLSEP